MSLFDSFKPQREEIVLEGFVNPYSNYSPLFDAADNHTWLNSGASVNEVNPFVTSPEVAEEDDTPFLEDVANAPKNVASFAAVSLLSAANSFRNSFASIGNFLGGDFEEVDTAAWVSSIDDDLGQYYERHKLGADLTGLIVGSFIPGLGAQKAVTSLMGVFNAGAKVVKAAELGFVGKNMSQATGILAPQINKYMALAGKEMALGSSQFTLLNANVAKGLAAGVGKEFIEAAIFEAGVQATMFKNPILQEQDLGDIGMNIVTGGLLGGAVFGATKAMKFSKDIDNVLRGVDELSNKTRLIEPAPASFSHAETMLHYADQLESLQGRSKITIAQAKLDGTLDEALITRLGQVEESAKNAVALEMRKAIVSNAASPQLGNAFADSLFDKIAKDWKPLSSDTHAFIFKNLGDIEEIQLAGSRIKEFKAGDPERVHSYLRLGTGEISTDAPASVRLADKVADVHAWAAKNVKLDVPIKIDISKADQAEAKFVLAQGLKKGLKSQIKDGVWEIPAEDIALQEAALRLMKDAGEESDIGFSSVRIAYTPRGKGKTLTDAMSATSDLEATIIKNKKGVAAKLQKQATNRKSYSGDSTTDISKFTNIDSEVIVGMDAVGKTEYEKFFSRHGDDFTKPEYARMQYIAKQVEEGVIEDGNEYSAIAAIRAKQAEYKNSTRVVSESFMNNYGLGGILPEIKQAQMERTYRGGASPGLVTATNEDALTIGANMQLAGNVHKQLGARLGEEVTENIASHVQAIASNPRLALRFSEFNHEMAKLPEVWSLLDDKMIPAKLYTKIKNAEDPALLEELLAQVDEVGKAVPEEILPAVRSHIELNMKHKTAENTLRTAREGQGKVLHENAFIPMRPNLAKQPYHALVIDAEIPKGAPGRTTMIAANSADDLQARIDMARREGRQVITDKNTEDYHKALGDFDWEKTIYESLYDGKYQTQGKAVNWHMPTDPKVIAEQFLEFHTSNASRLADDAIRTRYATEFSQLENLDSAYRETATSVTGFMKQKAKLETTPYTSYIKTALNKSQADRSPMMQAVNKFASDIYDKNVMPVVRAFQKGESQIDEIGAALEDLSIKTAYATSAKEMYALVNHSIPDATLSKHIRTVNAFVGSILLQSDWLNSLNNAISTPILQSAEFASLIGKVKAGKLASWAFTDVPGMTDFSVANMPKLLGAAGKKVISGTIDPEVLEMAKKLNWDMTPMDQMKQIIELSAVTAEDTVATLTSKRNAIEQIVKAGNFMQKVTGNKWVETNSRLMTAQATFDLFKGAVTEDLITKQELYSITNTMVNRVHGNMIAAQRPLAFSGPVGQAVGLFQTYQFNLMQQMFRYIGESDKKSVAYLMGMQGTIFGFQGMPGFKALNEHIVANLAGNDKNFDLYDATGEVAGHGTLGDMLMYGTASTLLHTNLYTRGDLNPRNPTLLPTKLEDLPAVSILGRTFGNIYETGKNVANGVPIGDALLRGLEYNSISRPLSGLATVAQGYSTDGNGNYIYGNELWSWGTAVRFAGGKPLDEAKVRDAYFRVSTYQRKEMAKLDSLREQVRVSLVGDNPQEAGMFIQNEQEHILEKYLAAGGDQKNFSKWMVKQYKEANTSQALKMANDLKSPFSQRLQRYLGGEE